MYLFDLALMFLQIQFQIWQQFDAYQINVGCPEYLMSRIRVAAQRPVSFYLW